MSNLVVSLPCPLFEYMTAPARQRLQSVAQPASPPTKIQSHLIPPLTSVGCKLSAGWKIAHPSKRGVSLAIFNGRDKTDKNSLTDPPLRKPSTT